MHNFKCSDMTILRTVCLVVLFLTDVRQTTKNTMHINTLNNIHNALCFIVLLIQWISIIIMSGPGSQLLFLFFLYIFITMQSSFAIYIFLEPINIF